jgi:hypothetical protein
MLEMLIGQGFDTKAKSMVLAVDMRASFAIASEVFSRPDNSRQFDRVDCFVIGRSGVVTKSC